MQVNKNQSSLYDYYNDEYEIGEEVFNTNDNDTGVFIQWINETAVIEVKKVRRYIWYKSFRMFWKPVNKFKQEIDE